MWVLICAGAISGLLCGAILPPLDVTGPHQVIIYALVANGATLLLSMSVHDQLMRFLAVRPLPYLGKISCGLYVFHFLDIALGNALLAHFDFGSWWFRSAAAFIFTLALAGASYRFIERPFLNLKLKYETVHSWSV
jgi:peptidoglycan/LPS O-acetylase OafA/YrhL